MENILDFEKKPRKDFLDSFTLDVLTEVIGFANGSLALRQAGYKTLRDIYYADPVLIKNIPFIGKAKFVAIVKLFELYGYKYPPEQPTRSNLISLQEIRCRPCPRQLARLDA